MPFASHVPVMALLVALPLLSTAAEAAVVLTTNPTAYDGPGLDLRPFANGQFNFTFGPVSLPGGITMTANPDGGGNTGRGSVIGQGSYGLSNNGRIGGTATYIGLDATEGYVELAFDTLISSFGGYWNYAPNPAAAPVIGAYDEAGDLLAEFNLALLAPISTPAMFNAFVFRGMSSDATDIKSIRFSGAYMVLSGSPDGTVPLPAAGGMLLGGLMGLALLRRRKS